MNLTSIDDLTPSLFQEIISLSDRFIEVSSRPIPKVPVLRGKTLATVFYENSTRTRLSFEAAAKRLSCDTLTFNLTTSSTSKGESLQDTIQTLDAMGIDFLVIRHPLAGVARLASGWTNASVINAGDGCDEHPTQALIDCITLIQISNQLSDYDPDCQGSDWPYLKNLHIGIVGDIVHSRVARSNVRAFTRLGAKVTLVGPPTLLPSDASSWPVDITYDLDEVISQFDVVYALRFQKERIVQSLIPSLDEYIRYWGISSDRLDAMKPHCKIMHPGPINRGVELSSQAADCEKSVILRQVNNSVPVRMAVLAALSGVYVHDD